MTARPPSRFAAINRATLAIFASSFAAACVNAPFYTIAPATPEAFQALRADGTLAYACTQSGENVRMLYATLNNAEVCSEGHGCRPLGEVRHFVRQQIGTRIGAETSASVPACGSGS